MTIISKLYLYFVCILKQINFSKKKFLLHNKIFLIHNKLVLKRHLLVNITWEKSISLYFLTIFNNLDFCFWVSGGFAFDLWVVVISLKTLGQIVRENFANFTDLFSW